MPAWLFKPSAAASSETVVIVVHGQNGSRLDGLRIVRTAVEKAAVLDITYRNDLGAPKDDSRRLQYGATEWRDLDAAVQWAIEHGAQNVVLATKYCLGRGSRLESRKERSSPPRAPHAANTVRTVPN